MVKIIQANKVTNKKIWVKITQTKKATKNKIRMMKS